MFSGRTKKRKNRLRLIALLLALVMLLQIAMPAGAVPLPGNAQAWQTAIPIPGVGTAINKMAKPVQPIQPAAVSADTGREITIPILNSVYGEPQTPAMNPDISDGQGTGSDAGKPSNQTPNESPSETSNENPNSPPNETTNEAAYKTRNETPSVIPDVTPGEAIPGEFVVHFKKGISDATESKTIQSVYAEPVGVEMADDRTRLVEVKPGTDPEVVMDKLDRDPRVDYVEPNYVMSMLAVTDEPLYDQQWTLPEIDALGGWDTANTILAGGSPTPVTVAVIDTGVDAAHEDLAGRVLPGHNSIKDAQNPNDSLDDTANGHGTHVAGVISAVFDNGKGIAGVAGGLPVKVLPVKVLDSAGIGTMYDISQGIRWAVENGANVVNLSLGGRLPDYPLTLSEAVKYAQDNGVLVVAAAGNDGKSVEGFYPACLPGVISVGATGSNHQPAAFSNYGARLMAPGVDIISTLPGSSYGIMSGTSMAAPFVSGIAGILYSVFPNKTSSQIAAALEKGRKEFRYNYHYDYGWRLDWDSSWVANAHGALDQLDSGVYIYDGLTIIQPEDDSINSGMMDIVTQVTNPDNAAKVVFTLTNDRNERAVVGTVYDANQSGIYTLSFDTTTVPNGQYWLVAESYDENEQMLASGDIAVTISNQQQSGLVISVKKPDGSAAAGANVTVHHLMREVVDGKTYIQYEDVTGHKQKADMQGRLIINGADATDGNDYLITACGTEPNYFYYKILRAPANITLDASDARTLAISGKTTDGSPLAGASVISDLLGSSIAGDMDPDITLDTTESKVLVTLNAAGSGQITLTEGNYNFKLVDNNKKYFLSKSGLAVNDSLDALEFAPVSDEVATISLAAGQKYASTGFLLRDGYDLLYGFEKVAGNTPITVYPGTYQGVIDAVYLDPANSLEWNYRLETPSFDILAGETREIQFGNIQRASMQLPDWYGNYFTDFAHFATWFYDAFDNKVSYIGKQSYSASTSSTAEGAGRILFAKAAEKSEISLVTGKDRDKKGAMDAKTTPPELFALNSATGRFELISQAYTAIPGPALTVYQTVYGVDSPPVNTGNNSGSYYSGWPLGQWAAYWFIPADQSSGNYKAKISWAAGPFEPESGPVTSDPVLFVVQKGQTGPGEDAEALTVRVKDMDGLEDLNAQVSLLRLEDNRYMLEDQAETDGGIITFYPGNYGEYALLVTGPASSVDNASFIVFRPLLPEELAQEITVDASQYNLQKLTLSTLAVDKVLDGEGNPVDYSQDWIYSVCGYDQDGVPYKISVGKAGNPVGKDLYLPDGQYLFQADVTQKWHWGDEKPPLYHITKQVNVPEDVPADSIVTMGSEGLTALTVQGPPDTGGDVYRVAGVALFGNGQSKVPVFYPAEGQPILVSPGNYKAEAVLVREHYDAAWDYWLTNELAIGSAPVTWSVYGEPFTARIDLDAQSYSPGDTVRITHVINDNSGNRLMAIGINCDLYGGIMPSSLPAVTGGDSGRPVEGQNHEEIAPFITIKDANGREIYRYKDTGSNYYDLVDEWEGGGDYGEGDAGLTFVTYPEDCGTFMGAEFTLPETNTSPSYTIVLELGAGPEGLIRSEKTFGTKGLRLDQPASPTKAAEVTLTGVAPAGAGVSVRYVHNNGTVQVGTVTAGQDGRFSITAALPSGGTYEFIASALVEGVTTESAPVSLVVDRTPPAAPRNLSGAGQDETHITISWEASQDSDVDYYQVRRAPKGGVAEPVATVGADEELTLRDSGLLPGVDYEYLVIAVDKAGNESAPARITLRTDAAGDKVPPTAPVNVTAAAAAGGIIDVRWGASSDNVAVAGYRIVRISGNSAETAGAVGPNTLIYRDKGLAADTTYSYSVTAIDAAGNESAAGVSNSAKTPGLFITSVSWRVPRIGWSGPAVRGGNLVINVVGEPNRQAVAQVVYRYWDGSADQERTTTVNLSEEGQVSGTYKGSFVLPAGITQVTSIHADISDGFNHTAGKDAAGLPLDVAGSLAVNVELGTNAVSGDILKGWRLMAWSDKNNHGAAVNLNGPGVYSLDLIPGDDYTVRIFSTQGRVMAASAGITVLSGRAADVTITPSLPAALRIKVVEQGTAAGIGNAYIVLTRADGSYVNWGISSVGDGSVKGVNPIWEMVSGLHSNEQIVVKTELPTQDLQMRYEKPEAVTINLGPGENMVELVLEKKPMATLQGTVTDDNGVPLAGAQVVAVQTLNGNAVSLTAQTDENGEYALEVMPQETKVTFSHRATIPGAETVTPLPDTVTVLNSTLKRRGTVLLEVFTQRAGQPEYPLDMDWRVGVHFGLRIKNLTKDTEIGYYLLGSWPVVPVDNASPGDRIQISLNGAEAGMSNQTVVVELDNQKMAKAAFHLKELGKMQARVRDEQGQARKGYFRYVDVFRHEGQNTTWAYGMGFTTQDITLGSLKAGNYTAVFHWNNISRGYYTNGGRWESLTDSLEEWQNLLGQYGFEVVSIPFTVTDAEITDLGDVVLPYPERSGQGYFQGRPGNNFTAGVSEAVPGSIVTMRAGFSYQSGKVPGNPLDLKLFMTIPDDAALVADSTVVTMVYGQAPAISYPGNGQIQLDFGNAAAQPGGIQGIATYRVRISEHPTWPSTGARAWVQYSGIGYQYEELGTTTIKVPYVTITAPGNTVSRDVVVFGRAPAGVAVSVYDNGIYLGETTASGYGTWRTKITMPDMGRRAIHFLTARILNGDAALTSQAASVTYDPDKPYIAGVTMYQQDGRHITFDPTKGVASFPYVYVPGMDLTFEIKFNNNNNVKEVIVKSDSGAKLTATYNADKQVYVARGVLSNFGNWGSSQWSPGSIYISYKPKPQPYRPTPMPSQNTLRGNMPDAWRDATVTVAGAGAAGFKAQDNTVTFPQVSVALGGSQKKINLTFSVTALPNYVPDSSAAFTLGEGGTTVYSYNSVMQDDANGRVHFEVSAVVPMSALEPSPAAQALRAQSGAEHAMVKVLGESPIDGGLGVADLYDTIKAGFDFKETMDQLGAFLDSASSCSSSHNQYYRAMADSLAQRAMTNLCIKYGLQLGGMALAATGVGVIGTVAVWGISNILTEIGNAKWEKAFNDLKAEMAADEECKKDDDDDDDDDDSDKDKDKDKDKVTDPKWILDPSGYVYEAVPTNRVEDVKTTILEKDPGTNDMTVWDAVWYEQENPLYTDIAGRYGWDVPEGDWQVVYEKEGYETAGSEVMHVPPPRLDVNVGIVSLQAPAVKNISAVPGGQYIDIVFDKYMRVNTITNDTVTVSVYGDEGTQLTGSIAPLNQVADPNNDSVMLANSVRFTPETTLTVGGKYTVTVDEMVQSYAQRPMAADYQENVTVAAVPGDDNPPPNDPGDNNSSSGSHGNSAAPTNEQVFKVGSESKIVTAFDGELTVEIPAGAFGENVTLNIRKLGVPQAGKAGLTPGSLIYEFDTGGIKPKHPLKVTFRYDKSLPGNIDLRKLGVYRQDDNAISRWNYVGGILDQSTGMITVTLKGFSSYAVMAYDHSFNDLQGHWSQKDVEVLVSRNLVRGVNDGQFQPNRPITRAEMAALLVQMLSADPNRDTGFTPLVGSFADVPPNAWYFTSVEKAARYGLVKGSNNRFRPNEYVTREEMAVMLVNAMGLADSAKADLAKGLTYTDASGISPWAANFVALATRKGIMRGDATATFRPKGSASRAEAAVVILRAMEQMGLIYAFVTTSGTINVSSENKGYFEIKCSAGAVNYLLLPAGEDVRQRLADAAGKETEITGIAVHDPAGIAKTPVLQVVAVGGKPTKPGG